jgi:hypothetical protein
MDESPLCTSYSILYDLYVNQKIKHIDHLMLQCPVESASRPLMDFSVLSDNLKKV